MASGVLPIAIGEATKVISFIQNKIKKYSFIIKWGETTETDDKEGKVTGVSSVRPDFDEIQKVLKYFIGKVNQKPPIYSAIKINGQRSYKLARKNVDISHKFRKVEIYDLILKKIIDVDNAEFEVTCGKGTYIRSLARDISIKLKTKGHVIKLRRLSVGNFNEKDTIFIDFSQKILHSRSILNKILPIETVLDDIPALVLSEVEARRIKQGQKIQLKSFDFKGQFKEKYPNYQKFEKIYAIRNNNPVALIKIENGIVKPTRIINS